MENPMGFKHFGEPLYDRNKNPCLDVDKVQVCVGDYVVGAKRGGGTLLLGLVEKANMESYTVLVDPKYIAESQRKYGPVRSNIWLRGNSIKVLARYHEVRYTDDGFDLQR